MADSEAIFTTMLVELKLKIPEMFCITELADQLNSKFLGVAQLSESERKTTQNPLHTMEQENSFSNTALKSSSSSKVGPGTILTLPRYMAGRLIHPQLCENLLVQVQKPFYIYI